MQKEYEQPAAPEQACKKPAKDPTQNQKTLYS
jgi:hypothetical protein